MTRNGKPRDHDPMTCGIDPSTDCPRCRPATERLRRIEALEERLNKANISATDLADLVWYHLEDYLEDVVSRIAKDQIREKLSGLSLHSIIETARME